MWPWGHLAASYLLYSLGRRAQGRLPGGSEVTFLVIGALVPDVVDKPLGWLYVPLDSGRSVGHSLLVLATVIVLLYWLAAPRIGRGEVTAFAIGLLSHPFADFPFHDVLAGDWSTTAYFLWPFRSMPPAETIPSVTGYLFGGEAGAYDAIQIALGLLALGLWLADGKPGWPTSRAVGHRFRAASDAEGPNTERDK